MRFFNCVPNLVHELELFRFSLHNVTAEHIAKKIEEPLAQLQMLGISEERALGHNISVHFLFSDNCRSGNFLFQFDFISSDRQKGNIVGSVGKVSDQSWSAKLNVEMAANLHQHWICNWLSKCIFSTAVCTF